jgi:hypothetical protein
LDRATYGFVKQSILGEASKHQRVRFVAVDCGSGRCSQQRHASISSANIKKNCFFITKSFYKGLGIRLIPAVCKILPKFRPVDIVI